MRDFTIAEDGWMYVGVSPIDWQRLCPSCGRPAVSFAGWMLKPPNYGVCIDCYEANVAS